jgi:SRSO17 transposase
MSSVYARKLLRIHKLQHDIWELTSLLASLCATAPALAGREQKRDNVDTHTTRINKERQRKDNKEEKGKMRKEERFRTGGPSQLSSTGNCELVLWLMEAERHNGTDL